MRDVVEEYQDEVVERRRRTVHVCESVVCEVSSWHGGRKLSDHTGYSSVPAAIQAAERLAVRHAIGPGSTLRLRIEERVRRDWRAVREVDPRNGYVTYDDARVRPCLSLRRRHVWDSRDGLIEPRWADAPFELRMWVGLKGNDVPHDALRACYVDVEVETHDCEALYAGYGVGGARIRDLVIAEATPPAHIDDARDVTCFLGVVLSGTCQVTSPEDSDGDGLARFLDGCHVRPILQDSAMDVLKAFGPSPAFWVGEPGAKVVWGGARLPAPSVALAHG